jgi:endoglucanase
MFELIKTLCELVGPSGDEGEVQTWLADSWRGRTKSLELTPVGNLIAHVGGRGPRILIAAHADEICYVVRYISNDGYVWLGSGQRDVEQRPSQRSPYFLPLGHPALIKTATGTVEGVFATLTGHILTPYQRAKTQLEWTDFWVDIGAGSRSEARARGIRIGDRVIPNTPTRRQGEFVYGKAMDDRVVLAVMDRLLDVLDHDRLAYDVVFASTVQEELGLIGADSVARHMSYDYGIALDVGLVGDVPGVDARDIANRLGYGPVIVHKDAYAYNRAMIQRLTEVAEDAGIQYQDAVYVIYGSDAASFIRQGVPSALITVPTRYTHSPFEMVHLRDVERTVDLLKAFLETPATVA